MILLGFTQRQVEEEFELGTLFALFRNRPKPGRDRDGWEPLTLAAYERLTQKWAEMQEPESQNLRA